MTKALRTSSTDKPKHVALKLVLNAFETDRSLLRPFEDGDLLDLARLYASPVRTDRLEVGTEPQLNSRKWVALLPE